MAEPNTTSNASAPAEVAQDWRVKSWPNGDYCECLYIDGQYVGETRKPTQAAIDRYITRKVLEAIRAS